MNEKKGGKFLFGEFKNERNIFKSRKKWGRQRVND